MIFWRVNRIPAGDLFFLLMRGLKRIAMKKIPHKEPPFLAVLQILLPHLFRGLTTRKTQEIAHS